MAPSTLSPYIVGCKDCRLCKGAAYQLPPFLFAGSSNPRVLVIAQNPGEIHGDKENEWRFDLGKLVINNANGDQIKAVYDVDFITSHGHNQMAKIFGDDWLTGGKFMYTNAVRCRTEKNAAPSPEMVQNCQGWTAQLPIPDVVVLMGKTAANQFCSMVGKPELSPWKMVKLDRSKKTTYIITIPHYAAMKSSVDFENARKLFQRALDEAGVLV